MTDDSDLDLRKIWHENHEDNGMNSEISLLQKDKKLSFFVKWRNLIEYFAGLIVFMAYTYYIFTIDNIFIKLGSTFIIFATAFVILQIKLRSSANMKHQNSEPVITFYRRKLERERDMLRSVWRWYILPFVPGFCLLIYGQKQMWPDADFSTYLILVSILTVFIIALNLWGAKRIQAKIDELP